MTHDCPGGAQCIRARVEAQALVRKALRLLRSAGAKASARKLQATVKGVEGAVRHGLRLHAEEARELEAGGLCLQCGVTVGVHEGRLNDHGPGGSRGWGWCLGSGKVVGEVTAP